MFFVFLYFLSYFCLVDFDSDNEAPEDKLGQKDKIIKNHVIKEIIKPGKGLSKPSRFDFLICNNII